MTALPRRSALTGIGFAAMTAALATPAKAASTADAELIAQCNRIAAIEARMNEIYKIRTTLEIERQTEPDILAMFGEQEDACALIEPLLPPRTLAGAQALARAALCMAGRDADGSVS